MTHDDISAREKDFGRVIKGVVPSYSKMCLKAMTSKDWQSG